MTREEAIIQLEYRKDFATKDQIEALDMAITALNGWITDRDPTPEEIEAAGDVGFILCISGEYVAQTYDHAIDMSSNFYEDGAWYVHGVKAKWATVHGWMMPPSWEG